MWQLHSSLRLSSASLDLICMSRTKEKISVRITRPPRNISHQLMRTILITEPKTLNLRCAVWELWGLWHKMLFYLACEWLNVTVFPLNFTSSENNDMKVHLLATKSIQCDSLSDWDPFALVLLFFFFSRTFIQEAALKCILSFPMTTYFHFCSCSHLLSQLIYSCTSLAWNFLFQGPRTSRKF